MKALLVLLVVIAVSGAQAQIYTPSPLCGPLGCVTNDEPIYQPPPPGILPGQPGSILPPPPVRCWNRGGYVVCQ
jgi:hypothetical protein